MKMLLAGLERLPDSTAATVKASLGPEVVRAIEEASGVEWLSAELNLATTRAVHATLGPRAFARFFRALSGESFRGPLFRAIVEGAIAVFGLDPGSWTRLLPSGWGMVFRDLGRWEVQRSGDHVDLTLSSLPAPFLADRVWPESVAASLGGLVDLAKTEGGVEVVEVDAPRGKARFVMRWVARPV